MGLLGVPSGTALWHLLQVDLPAYTGDFISHFRLVIVLAGLFVGFLVGLTGVGGGTLLTPLLIFLGVRPTIAVGSDLLYGAITKLFNKISMKSIRESLELGDLSRENTAALEEGYRNVK